MFINDVTQVGGGGLTLCDNMYEGLSKTGTLVWQSGVKKSPNLRDIINEWPLKQPQLK